MFALLTTALAHESIDLDANIQLGTELAIHQARSSDVYAMGERLTIDAPVRGDVSGMVARVEVTRRGRIEGDLQVLGAEVVLDGPVEGSVRGAIASLTLDAPVSGSLEVALDEVVVGRGGRIEGDLAYTSRQRLPALERVVAGHVKWERAREDGESGLTFDLDL